MTADRFDSTVEARVRTDACAATSASDPVMVRVARPAGFFDCQWVVLTELSSCHRVAAGLVWMLFNSGVPVENDRDAGSGWKGSNGEHFWMGSPSLSDRRSILTMKRAC